MNSLLAALGATLVYLDSWPVGQFMLGRPVLLLPLLGLALGLPAEGLWLGLVLELFMLRTLPMGSTLTPDPALGGCWTLLAFWLACGRGHWTPAPLALTETPTLPLLAGIALSWLAPWLTEVQRRLNGSLWRPRFEQAVERGDESRIQRLMPLALGQSALLAFAASLLVLEGLAGLVGPLSSWSLSLQGPGPTGLSLGFLLLVVSWGGLWRHAAGRRGSWSLWGGVAAGSTLALLGSLL